MKEYEAAEYLGLKTRTLTTHRYAKTGPEYCIIYGGVFYHESALDIWADQKRKVGAKPLGDKKRVRLHCVIKPKNKSTLQIEADRLGLSVGRYVDKLIEEIER